MIVLYNYSIANYIERNYNKIIIIINVILRLKIFYIDNSMESEVFSKCSVRKVEIDREYDVGLTPGQT